MSEEEKRKVVPDNAYQQAFGFRNSYKACFVSKEFRDKIGFRQATKMALHKKSDPVTYTDPSINPYERAKMNDQCLHNNSDAVNDSLSGKCTENNDDSETISASLFCSSRAPEDGDSSATAYSDYQEKEIDSVKETLSPKKCHFEVQVDQKENIKPSDSNSYGAAKEAAFSSTSQSKDDDEDSDLIVGYVTPFKRQLQAKAEHEYRKSLKKYPMRSIDEAAKPPFDGIKDDEETESIFEWVPATKCHFEPQVMFSEKAYPEKFVHYSHPEKAPVNHLLKSKDNKQVTLVLKSSKYELVDRYFPEELFEPHNNDWKPPKSILKVKRDPHQYNIKTVFEEHDKITAEETINNICAAKRQRTRHPWELPSIKKKTIVESNLAIENLMYMPQPEPKALDAQETQRRFQTRQQKEFLLEDEYLKSYHMERIMKEEQRLMDEQRKVDEFYAWAREHANDPELEGKRSKRQRLKGKAKRLKDSFFRHLFSHEHYLRWRQESLMKA